MLLLLGTMAALTVCPLTWLTKVLSVQAERQAGRFTIKEEFTCVAINQKYQQICLAKAQDVEEEKKQKQQQVNKM